MSINLNRSELNKLVTNKEYRCKVMYSDPYEDDYFAFSKGFYRAYKTWKHNRKTQWKNV